MTSLVSGTGKVGQCTSCLARNTRCNSSSEQSGPTPSKMKRHRHSTELERHEPSGIVSYIDLDRLEVYVQQGHVVNDQIPWRCDFREPGGKATKVRNCRRPCESPQCPCRCICFRTIEPCSSRYRLLYGKRTEHGSLTRRQNHAS